jgi:hypothetical protein
LVACRFLLLLLRDCLLGSLERVDFEVFGLDLDFYVGSKVADTVEPFFVRSGICTADSADAACYYPITPFTIIDYHLARTAREYTPLLPPESTLAARKNRLTLHEENLPSNSFIFRRFSM